MISPCSGYFLLTCQNQIFVCFPFHSFCETGSSYCQKQQYHETRKYDSHRVYCFTILMKNTTCSKVTPVDVRQFKKGTHTGTQYEDASVARINLKKGCLLNRHSPVVSSGMNVQLLVSATRRVDNLLVFKPSIAMRKKDLRMSEIVVLLRFSCPSPGFT